MAREGGWRRLSAFRWSCAYSVHPPCSLSGRAQSSAPSATLCSNISLEALQNTSYYSPAAHRCRAEPLRRPRQLPYSVTTYRLVFIICTSCFSLPNYRLYGDSTLVTLSSLTEDCRQTTLLSFQQCSSTPWHQHIPPRPSDTLTRELTGDANKAGPQPVRLHDLITVTGPGEHKSCHWRGAVHTLRLYAHSTASAYARHYTCWRDSTISFILPPLSPTLPTPNTARYPTSTPFLYRWLYIVCCRLDCRCGPPVTAVNIAATTPR